MSVKIVHLDAPTNEAIHTVAISAHVNEVKGSLRSKTPSCTEV